MTTRPSHPTHASTDRRVFACRVSSATPYTIDKIAAELGCLRINNNSKLVGATGVMLDAIAQGRLKVVPVDIAY